jgi:hypothetical protein
VAVVTPCSAVAPRYTIFFLGAGWSAVHPIVDSVGGGDEIEAHLRLILLGVGLSSDYGLRPCVLAEGDSAAKQHASDHCSGEPAMSFSSHQRSPGFVVLMCGSE